MAMTKNRFMRILTAYYTCASNDDAYGEIQHLTDRELADFLAVCEVFVSSATLEQVKRKNAGKVGGRSCY
jgi:hypothetical protein